MKILVIDDDEQIRGFLKKVLLARGYTVCLAVDGEEAMNLAADSVFDLIITDIIMPNKDGLEVIMEIGKFQKNTKFIAISGGGNLSSHHYLDFAKILGASIIIKKPFEADDLLNAVDEVFR